MMSHDEQIAAAKALLEQEGFAVKKPDESEWKVYGAVVSVNMIAPGLTEKRFVQVIENAIKPLFDAKKALAIAVGSGADIVQMGPLHVKSLVRVKAGLSRKGEKLEEVE